MTTPSAGWARPTPGWTTPSPVWTDVNPSDLHMAAAVMLSCARRLTDIAEAAGNLPLQTADFSLLAGPGPASAYQDLQSTVTTLLGQGATTCGNTSTELIKAAVLYASVEQDNSDRLRKIW